MTAICKEKWNLVLFAFIACGIYYGNNDVDKWASNPAAASVLRDLIMKDGISYGNSKKTKVLVLTPNEVAEDWHAAGLFNLHIQLNVKSLTEFHCEEDGGVW